MREQDRVEFEWVFRSAYPSVLRTTSVILHDRGRAEEVTQEAFLRLYERWRGAVAVDHPAAWVRTVAIHEALRRGRRDGPVAEHVDGAGPDTAFPDVDLARAVAALPVKQRAAVALYYLEDRPVDEIAHLMGVSSSTVKQHLYRARARLAAVLAEPAGDAPELEGVGRERH